MNEELSEAYAPLATPDTNNATSITWQDETVPRYPQDGYPGETYRERFKNFDLLNQGAYNGQKWENKDLVRYRLNEWGTRSVASQVELLPWQTSKASTYIHSLQLNEWGKNASLVMFGICSLLVHEDSNDVRKTYPDCTDRDPLFEKIQLSLGITDKQVRSIYQKLKQHFDTHGAGPKPQFDRFGTDSYEPEIYQGKRITGVHNGVPQYGIA
jgi:hypothetical protein